MTDADIQAAIAAIGTERDDDYLIAPLAHATRYAERAPALAAVLNRSRVRTAAEEYVHFDSVALEAQRVFRRTASMANLAVLITSGIGAAVLVLALFQAPRPVLMAVGLAGSAVGAYAAFLTQQIKQRQLLDRWMHARAQAETQRQELFLAATGADVDGSTPALWLLQLEYFRRYQLEVQVRYYGSRQRDHERAADRTAFYGALAVSVAAFSTGVGGLLGAMAGTEWGGIAALGVLGTALASYALVRDSIGQDSRNAARYARTRASLQRLAARLDDVREAVAAGNREALDAFITAVTEQVSVEHRQWLSEAESTHAALGQLESALAKRANAQPARSSD